MLLKEAKSRFLFSCDYLLLWQTIVEINSKYYNVTADEKNTKTFSIFPL